MIAARRSANGGAVRKSFLHREQRRAEKVMWSRFNSLKPEPLVQQDRPYQERRRAQEEPSTIVCGGEGFGFL